MDRKKAIVAQFIKSAYKISQDKKISGRTSLEKLVCFSQLERGLNTGFNFQPNHYGLYDKEVINISEQLKKDNLIETEYIEAPHPQWSFLAKEELLKFDTGLSEKEIKIIENTIKEYWRKGNKDISTYCKQLYVNKNKKRVDNEIREYRLKEDSKPLKELITVKNAPEWWKNAPAK